MRFDLTGADDRELPLILGLMPVLAKHAIDPATFEDTTLDADRRQRPLCDRRRARRRQRDAQAQSRLLGARSCDQSRLLELRRGAHRLLPRRQLAFRGVQERACYDVRAEHDPGRWETAYDFPAVRDGRIVKEQFPTGMPKGMSGLVFNTRRPIFADIRVREAIGLLFDFEWVNHNFFFDRYRRTASYFEGSELVRARPSGRRARARPARAVSRCGARRRDGRHLGAAGHRRLRARSRDAQARARPVRRRRLRARRAPYCATRATKQPFALRVPGHHQGSGAARDRLLARPQARRHHACACAWSMPSNTTGGASPTTST